MEATKEGLPSKRVPLPPAGARRRERNSNSLTNQLGIHLILAKREKLVSNSLGKPTRQK
jgi:hypothetical protein